MNSLRKGKRFERELANFLKALGFKARRGRQFKGGPDSPDVIVEGERFHIEAKAGYERFDPKWIEQAKKDAGALAPIVIWKQDRKKPVACLTVETLNSLAALYQLKPISDGIIVSCDAETLLSAIATAKKASGERPSEDKQP